MRVPNQRMGWAKSRCLRPRSLPSDAERAKVSPGESISWACDHSEFVSESTRNALPTSKHDRNPAQRLIGLAHAHGMLIAAKSPKPGKWVSARAHACYSGQVVAQSASGLVMSLASCQQRRASPAAPGSISFHCHASTTIDAQTHYFWASEGLNNVTPAANFKVDYTRLKRNNSRSVYAENGNALIARHRKFLRVHLATDGSLLRRRIDWQVNYLVPAIWFWIASDMLYREWRAVTTVA